MTRIGFFVGAVVLAFVLATANTTTFANSCCGAKKDGKECNMENAKDCAMNVNPNSKELASIAITTAKTTKDLLGINPKIAMLSFATHNSNKHELVIKVKDATKECKKLIKNAEIAGNIQLDAAMDPNVLKVKHPNSNFTPPANVLIFPNLDSGNIGYKLVQRFSKAQAIGPILQGLKKPVNDLSRGCSAEEIVNTVSVTVNQCN